MTTATQSAQTELALATYGSPLRKRGVGPALAATLCVFILFFLWQLTTVFRDPQPATLGVFLVALSVTGVLSLIPVLVYRWLDRREPEPWFMYGLAFLWGALIAGGMALEINTALDRIVGGFLGGAFAAPIVEGTAKGLGLIVLLVVMRGEFDGPRDGFLYGALIGLGFNWTEASVYHERLHRERHGALGLPARRTLCSAGLLQPRLHRDHRHVHRPQAAAAGRRPPHPASAGRAGAGDTQSHALERVKEPTTCASVTSCW